MRTLLLAAALLLLCANPTQAQNVGDRVVVKVPKANLKKLDEVIGQVRQWTFLTIREVEGDWLWVVNSFGNEADEGWIKRQDVVLLAGTRFFCSSRSEVRAGRRLNIYLYLRGADL